MRVKRRMAAIEFETIRPFLKISDDRIKAARAAMVDGRTHQSIGEEFGWTKQAVGDSVSHVWRALQAYHESQAVAARSAGLLPPGWEQVTLTAPSELVAKFREEIALVSSPPKKTRPKNKPKV